MKNVEKALENVLADLSERLKVGLCVHDMHFSENISALKLPLSLMEHRCKVCVLMKGSERSLSRCIEEENAKTLIAAASEKPTLHTCYAGVSDLLVPVKLEGRQIGAILLGQVVTQPRNASQRWSKSLQKNFGIDAAAHARALQDLPQMTQKELKGFGKLLLFFREYIEQSERLSWLERQQRILAKSSRDIMRSPAEALRDGTVPAIPTEELLERLTKHNVAMPVRRALVVIKEIFYRNVTQAQIAQEVGMSSFHFSREFRRWTGMTFRDCLLITRMNAAHHLVRNYNISWKEAANLVGYEDYNSFLRAFKKSTGYSPLIFTKKFPRTPVAIHP